MAKLFVPFQQAVNANGAPISGAQLWFYITGTTTPKDTYSQSDLAPGHVNTNPVVADSNGRFPPIYLAQDADYKAILKDASNVTLETIDPLLAIQSSVIAHQGSLIVGNSLGADSELLISATAGAHLKSDGTTASWASPNYTVQKFTSGSGTYTTPAGCVAIKVRVVGGGGGAGGEGGTTGPTGTTGGTSSFNSITAIGGSGGVGSTSGLASVGWGNGGIGGTGGAGAATLRTPGCGGGNGFGTGTLSVIVAGAGGATAFGGAPIGKITDSQIATGTAGGTNTGAGGGGCGTAGAQGGSGGGGGGEYFELWILSPSATYPYAVGAGGAGGVGTGTNACTGGAGASGLVIVEEYYT